MNHTTARRGILPIRRSGIPSTGPRRIDGSSILACDADCPTRVIRRMRVHQGAHRRSEGHGWNCALHNRVRRSSRRQGFRVFKAANRDHLGTSKCRHVSQSHSTAPCRFLLHKEDCATVESRRTLLAGALFAVVLSMRAVSAALGNERHLTIVGFLNIVTLFYIVFGNIATTPAGITLHRGRAPSWRLLLLQRRRCLAVCGYQYIPDHQCRSAARRNGRNSIPRIGFGGCARRSCRYFSTMALALY